MFVITIFNELCVLTAYASSVILAYYDYQKVYTNVSKRNFIGKFITYSSTGLMFVSLAMV